MKECTESVFIVMPAYNEEANIEDVIKSWHAVVQQINASAKLVIFDDGSKDNTYQTMLSLQTQYPQLIPIKKTNSGHGPTCLFAYQYAIEQQADYIFQTDSDGQTSPDDFWKFYDNRKNYDFVIGYRNNREDGFFRKITSLVLKLSIFFIYGIWAKDSNTPFRMLNAKKLAPLLPKIPNNFFLANVLLVILIIKYKKSLQHTLLWLPIQFKERAKGENSINYLNIFKIGMGSIQSFYRTKI